MSEEKKPLRLWTRPDIDPRLCFLFDFDECTELDVEAKGWLSHVLIRLAPDRLYPVIFFDYATLAHELEYHSRSGLAYVAEPGLILLRAITRANLSLVVDRLIRDSFFQRFVPLTEADLAELDTQVWPPIRRPVGWQPGAPSAD